MMLRANAVHGHLEARLVVEMRLERADAAHDPDVRIPDAPAPHLAVECYKNIQELAIALAAT